MQPCPSQAIYAEILRREARVVRLTVICTCVYVAELLLNQCVSAETFPYIYVYQQTCSFAHVYILTLELKHIQTSSIIYLTLITVEHQRARRTPANCIFKFTRRPLTCSVYGTIEDYQLYIVLVKALPYRLGLVLNEHIRSLTWETAKESQGGNCFVDCRIQIGVATTVPPNNTN